MRHCILHISRQKRRYGRFHGYTRCTIEQNPNGREPIQLSAAGDWRPFPQTGFRSCAPLISFLLHEPLLAHGWRCPLAMAGDTQR